MSALPEDIVQNYPTLELAGVYAVITYVLQNRPRVDAYMFVRQAEADSLRGEIEQRFAAQKGFRERLLARRTQLPAP